MPPKVARLAGLGAFAACAGLLALYGLLVFISMPSPQHGIDRTSAAVTWISLGGLFAALIGAHVVIAKRLLALAKSPDTPRPL